MQRNQSHPYRLMLTGLSLGMAVGLLGAPPASAAEFRDTRGHWAEEYISALADQNILGGFPDGSFRPDAPVTRAQFAAIVDSAFKLSNGRRAAAFADVPTTYWAFRAIQDASSNDLVAGFPDGTFRPNEPVTRAQSLIVYAKGTQAPRADLAVLDQYRDARSIPRWAESSVAAATGARLVVNYPDPDLLNPNRSATRADVAAFTYQALANLGQVAALDGPERNRYQSRNNERYETDQNTYRNDQDAYQSGQNGNQSDSGRYNLQSAVLRAGTVIPASFMGNERLYVAPNETRQFDLAVSGGNVPYGSRINGQFEPAPGGVRFIARSIEMNGRIFPLQARSAILKDVKDPRRTSTGGTIRDSAIGAAAGALIAGLTGDRAIATEEVLGGAAFGGILGNFTAPQIVVIEPEQAIGLTVTSDTTLR